MSPPEVDVTHFSGGLFSLNFTYPGQYADAIAFRLIRADDLTRSYVDAGVDIPHQGGDTWNLTISIPSLDPTQF